MIDSLYAGILATGASAAWFFERIRANSESARARAKQIECDSLEKRIAWAQERIRALEAEIESAHNEIDRIATQEKSGSKSVIRRKSVAERIIGHQKSIDDVMGRIKDAVDGARVPLTFEVKKGLVISLDIATRVRMIAEPGFRTFSYKIY
jgi:septal ring factor EnvC (AmiA/AmiB activator)